MAGILGSVPISTAELSRADVGNQILDYVFQKNAILLNDTLQILTGASIDFGIGQFSLPLPLIGFEFQQPDEVELLRYTYSEYPYIDKNVITNALIKENTRFSVVGIRPITYTPNTNGATAVNNFSTSVVGNYLTNELILSTLQMYCDRGGTFTLLTMWGQINNLVLERLSGVRTEGGSNQFGGQAYRFEFKRVQFPKKPFQVVRNTLSKLTLGIL